MPLQARGRSARRAQHLLAPVTEQVWRLVQRPCCQSAQRIKSQRPNVGNRMCERGTEVGRGWAVQTVAAVWI